MVIESNLANIVFKSYTPTWVRIFCFLRFAVLRHLLTQIIAPSLSDCQQVIDIGCGYGLISCLLSVSHPSISYVGIDINPWRIRRARQAASRLQISNLRFWCADARSIQLKRRYDAILLIDVLHHIDNPSKHSLLATCASSLSPNGVLVIKDILPHPYPKFMFTYVLDMIVTGSRNLWYWKAAEFQQTLETLFQQVETPASTGISPYPHAVYLCRNSFESYKTDEIA